MHEKLKSWLADDTVYIAVLLVLVGVGSFGLGRLSLSEGGQASLNPAQKVQLLASSTVLISKIATSTTPEIGTNGASVIASEPHKPALTGPYVGSKSGTKYYLMTCSGVKRIKDANKVFFATKNDAEASGYTPATNCAM